MINKNEKSLENGIIGINRLIFFIMGFGIKFFHVS